MPSYQIVSARFWIFFSRWCLNCLNVSMNLNQRWMRAVDGCQRWLRRNGKSICYTRNRKSEQPHSLIFHEHSDIRRTNFKPFDRLNYYCFVNHWNGWSNLYVDAKWICILYFLYNATYLTSCFVARFTWRLIVQNVFCAENSRIPIACAVFLKLDK